MKPFFKNFRRETKPVYEITLTVVLNWSEGSLKEYPTIKILKIIRIREQILLSNCNLFNFIIRVQSKQYI